MPNNCLSVLYKHIIQVENKNVGIKVGGHKHTIAPPIKKVGGHMPPLPPSFLRQCTYIHTDVKYKSRCMKQIFNKKEEIVTNTKSGNMFYWLNKVCSNKYGRFRKEVLMTLWSYTIYAYVAIVYCYIEVKRN